MLKIVDYWIHWNIAEKYKRKMKHAVIKIGIRAVEFIKLIQKSWTSNLSDDRIYSIVRLIILELISQLKALPPYKRINERLSSFK